MPQMFEARIGGAVGGEAQARTGEGDFTAGGVELADTQRSRLGMADIKHVRRLIHRQREGAPGHIIALDNLQGGRIKGVKITFIGRAVNPVGGHGE